MLFRDTAREVKPATKKFTQRQLRALGAQPHEEDGRYYPPSDTTFQRVLKKLDAAQFATLVGTWLAEQEIGALARLAVDGKVLRGSGRHDGKPLQLLSAVTHHLRLTLDQMPIEEKSNEIPALAPLLKKIAPPPGTLITADALHCQQASARFITQELGGDYLFGLKGNQSGILEKAQHLLAQQGFPPSGAVGQGPRAAGSPARGPRGGDAGGERPVRLLAGDRRRAWLGEDANRTQARPAAAVLASLRNLAIGVYELERERQRTQVDTLKSWCQQQTFSTLWPILQR